MTLVGLDTETLAAKLAVELDPAHAALLERFPFRPVPVACVPSEVLDAERAYVQRLRTHLDLLASDPVYRAQQEADRVVRWAPSVPVCPSCASPIDPMDGCPLCRWELRR